MKTLTINNRTISYEVIEEISEWGYGFRTEFFDGVKTTYRKKYYLFGELIPIIEPNLIFILYYNIEDDCYTKEQIREAITKKLNSYNRKLEIEKGEII